MNMSEIIDNWIGNLFLCICSIIMAKIIINKRPYRNIFKFTFKELISTIFISILESVNHYYFDDVVKTIISFLLIFLLFKINFKENIWKDIMLTFIYSIALLIVDILYVIFFIGLLQKNAEYFTSYIAYSITTNLIVSLLFLLLVLTFRKLLRAVYKIKVNTNKLIFVFMVLTFLCICEIAYIGFSTYEVNETMIISIGATVLFITILLSLIHTRNNNEKLELKYDSIISMMSNYEEEVEKQRIIHHENKNQLVTIRSMINEENNKEELLKYINSLLQDEQKVDKGTYSRFKYLPSNGIKGLMYYKTMNAEKKGIQVQINISKDLEESILFHLDTSQFKQFCRLIGVYLDNAIESAEYSKEKYLGIEVMKEEDKVYIIISNSYSGEIDLSKISKAGVTTKGKNHGYGLTLAKKILKDSDIFEEENEITEHLYIQKLILTPPKLK